MFFGKRIGPDHGLVNYSGTGDFAVEVVPFKVYQDDTAYLAIAHIGSVKYKNVHFPNDISFTVVAQQLVGTQPTKHLREVTNDIKRYYTCVALAACS